MLLISINKKNAGSELRNFIKTNVHNKYFNGMTIIDIRNL